MWEEVEVKAPSGSSLEHLAPRVSELLKPVFDAQLKQRRAPAPALQGCCSALKWSSKGTQVLGPTPGPAGQL